MNKGMKYAIIGMLLVLIIGLIVAVRTVDVAPIGPAETSIGLSHLNGAVANAIGFHESWYRITEALGILAILIAAGFGVLGVLQWIRRKSLGRVDQKLFFLAGLYAATVLLYVLFEKVIINYRPVLMPGETDVEASFPSSHTMLAIVVLGSTILLLPDYVKNKTACTVAKIVCGVALIASVIGRLLSGAHWLTDIMGGVLIGAALLALFRLLTESIETPASQKGK